MFESVAWITINKELNYVLLSRSTFVSAEGRDSLMASRRLTRCSQTTARYAGGRSLVASPASSDTVQFYGGARVSRPVSQSVSPCHACLCRLVRVTSAREWLVHFGRFAGARRLPTLGSRRVAAYCLNKVKCAVPETAFGEAMTSEHRSAPR